MIIQLPAPYNLLALPERLSVDDVLTRIWRGHSGCEELKSVANETRQTIKLHHFLAISTQKMIHLFWR
jgi:hypothetical protein